MCITELRSTCHQLSCSGALGVTDFVLLHIEFGQNVAAMICTGLRSTWFGGLKVAVVG